MLLFYHSNLLFNCDLSQGAITPGNNIILSGIDHNMLPAMTVTRGMQSCPTTPVGMVYPPWWGHEIYTCTCSPLMTLWSHGDDQAPLPISTLCDQTPHRDRLLRAGCLVPTAETAMDIYIVQGENTISAQDALALTSDMTFATPFLDISCHEAIAELVDPNML